MLINGYAAKTAGAELTKFQYEKDIQSHEVLVRVHFVSMTLGDVRFIDDYWNETQYPFIPGAEIIGTVEETGKLVKDLCIGDTVGIGYQVGACFACEYCKAGSENYCKQQQLIGISHPGGLADRIVVDHRFVFRIPEELQPENAVSLMCSGLTVYSALKRFPLNPESVIGVVGIGNLGHLALQFLRAFKCRTTAFSHTPSKEQPARSLGANNFVMTDGLAQIDDRFDLILVTTSGEMEVESYLRLLKPEGSLCFVGLPERGLSFKAEILADYASRSVRGSYIGNRQETGEVLSFAANNEIKANVEVFPFDEVNQAIEKMRKGQIPFSTVLKAEIS